MSEGGGAVQGTVGKCLNLNQFVCKKSFLKMVDGLMLVVYDIPPESCKSYFFISHVASSSLLI